ncbi:MAG: hypothetical protein WCG42_09860 [Parachlamydiaceae bacterium]
MFSSVYAVETWKPDTVVQRLGTDSFIGANRYKKFKVEKVQNIAEHHQGNISLRIISTFSNHVKLQEVYLNDTLLGFSQLYGGSGKGKQTSTGSS